MSSEDSNSSNSMVLPDHHDGCSDRLDSRPAVLIPDARGMGLPGVDENESDNFRMYKLKVYPCFVAYVHNWTQCPNYHPGENARRRNPKKYDYSPLQCPNHRLGLCLKGDACEFAHGLFETWLHPAQYRIKLCRDRDQCDRNVCFFAHNAQELRPIYKETGCAQRQYPTELSPSASPYTPKHNRSVVSPETSSSDTGKLNRSQHRAMNTGSTEEKVNNPPRHAMLRAATRTSSGFGGANCYDNINNSTVQTNHQLHVYDSPLNKTSQSQSFSPAPNFNDRLNPQFVSRATRFMQKEGSHHSHNSFARSNRNDFGHSFLACNRFR